MDQWDDISTPFEVHSYTSKKEFATFSIGEYTVSIKHWMTRKSEATKSWQNLSLANKFRKLYSRHVYVTLSNPDNRIITTSTKKPISASAQRSFLRFNSRGNIHERAASRSGGVNLDGTNFSIFPPNFARVYTCYMRTCECTCSIVREGKRRNEGGRRSISSLTSQATTCRRLDLSRPIIERKQFINRPCASKQIDRIAPDRARMLLLFRAFLYLQVLGVSFSILSWLDSSTFKV